MQFRKLLVVDFDFFFLDKLGSDNPDSLMYDWGHVENRFFIEALWPNRASAFLRNGMDLPGTTGEEVGFWDRFSFDPHTKLYFAESNASAVNPIILSHDDCFTQVWLYDAHHDAGYRQDRTAREVTNGGVFSCEDWMVLYHAVGAKLHVRYPRWKTWAFEIEPRPLVRLDRKFDDGEPPKHGRAPIQFDRVFVCRSGAWVPSWLDEQFRRFLADCPVRDQTQLGEIAERDFSMEEVRSEVDRMQRALEGQGALVIST